ncbi:cryptochrome/photolyase family protein [Hyphomonas oceanitis]|uniref:cryptochrome/photolyase family protein n=1 Tax=Hyphomonas oceanitis TaxID=81033 RepID=UPI00240FBA17|nr:deoxyribodipyrimidine photo-lyase [Hyphomonas oceanitis]
MVWFREDLRLADNPALTAAVKTGRPLVLLYIHDEVSPGLRARGGASKWWLGKSLAEHARQIEYTGGRLTIRAGGAEEVLIDIIAETGATSVFWNRRYGSAERTIDTDLKAMLRKGEMNVSTFNGRLLTEPWDITTGASTPYKVFTPYWKALKSTYRAPPVLAAPKALSGPVLKSQAIESLGLQPTNPDWSGGLEATWHPGEAGAIERLWEFLEGSINTYAQDRNRPDLEGGTSRLSPHLHFGEISPAQVWRAVQHGISAGKFDESNAMTFLSELVWREFSYVLLYYNPDLATENYNSDFDLLPWRADCDAVKSWRAGQTGYPIVDAGMRQLWHTGYMHNRVRMIVASFLTKHLLQQWQVGEDWFWDTLVDADPAANAASWQWTAGSGADAAPYFRVFNPITQGQKFDPHGTYVRRWCPELSFLPDKVLHTPWEADSDTLKEAGITLGTTYPKPIVDHATARQRALDAYDTLKEKRNAA